MNEYSGLLLNLRFDEFDNEDFSEEHCKKKQELMNIKLKKMNFKFETNVFQIPKGGKICSIISSNDEESLDFNMLGDDLDEISLILNGQKTHYKEE